MKKKLFKVLLPLGILAIAVALLGTSMGGPGTTYREGSRAGKVMSYAEGKATFTTPIVLGREDPEHEVDHVFDAFAEAPGIERVEVDFVAFTVTVKYDPSQVSEAQMADALRAGGYLAPAEAPKE